jgi:hypothetical protein
MKGCASKKHLRAAHYSENTSNQVTFSVILSFFFLSFSFFFFQNNKKFKKNDRRSQVIYTNSKPFWCKGRGQTSRLHMEPFVLAQFVQPSQEQAQLAQSWQV